MLRLVYLLTPLVLHMKLYFDFFCYFKDIIFSSWTRPPTRISMFILHRKLNRSTLESLYYVITTAS